MSKKVIIFFVTSGAITEVAPKDFASMTEAQRLAWANARIEATPSRMILKEVENAMHVVPHPPAVCLDERDNGEILAALPLWWDYKEAQGLGTQRDSVEKEIRSTAEAMEAAGVGPEALDEAVCDLASGLGSNANNGGIEEQLRFLARHGGIEEMRRVAAEAKGK